jgi:hypothetical protein
VGVGVGVILKWASIRSRWYAVVGKGWWLRELIGLTSTGWSALTWLSVLVVPCAGKVSCFVRLGFFCADISGLEASVGWWRRILCLAVLVAFAACEPDYIVAQCILDNLGQGRVAVRVGANEFAESIW